MSKCDEATPETGKGLPSPVRVTGEILWQEFSITPGEPWEQIRHQAVWDEYAERVNARLVAAGEPIQEAKE